MIIQLSIIIVTYNSEQLIFDCLDSIYKYNDMGNSLEIIIVDNCSIDCDRVFEKIRTDYPSDIVLIKSTVNNGYGHGNNQGVQAANAPRFIVINPDVRIIKPIFRKIMAMFEANQNTGMLGVCFVDGSNHLYFKPEHSNLFRMIFHNILIKYGFYRIEQMYFSGSFLAFNKQYFIEAGSFDENIFLYYEESDISNRILAIGKKTLLANDIFVLHLAHGREVNPFLLKIEADSRKYYFDKYHADLDKYYFYSLIMYRLKYLAAILLKNKIKAGIFHAMIEICKNKPV